MATQRNDPVTLIMKIENPAHWRVVNTSHKPDDILVGYLYGLPIYIEPVEVPARENWIEFTPFPPLY